MKTKMKFSDITNVIERDEMRKFLGGQGKIESANDTTPGPDELTPKGLVFGTPGVISAPLPGYPTPTYQGGQLNTVTITPRKSTSSYTSLPYVGSSNSVFNIGSSSGSRIGGGSGDGYYGGSGIIGKDIMDSAFKDIDQQRGNQKTDCFFQCLGWVSTVYGDFKHDTNYYASVYAFTHPNLASNNVINNLTGVGIGSGIPQSEAINFASSFFNVEDASGASSANLAKFVNPNTNPSGNNQLIGVYKTPTGGLHAVIVIEITKNQISYYDPQNGISDSKDRSEFPTFYKVTNK